MRAESTAGLRALVRRLREEAERPAKRGALFIAPTDFERLRLKGTHTMIQERDESGFFDRIVTFHPMNGAWKTHRLNPTNTVYEFGQSFVPGPGAWKFFRLLQVPLHLLFILSAALYLARCGVFNLIRATDPYWTGLLAWAVSSMTGIPFCISIHSDYDKCLVLDPERGAPRVLRSRRLAKWLEHFVLRRAQNVMPISAYVAKSALTNGAHQDAIRLIPHGIDLELFSRPKTGDQDKLGLPDDRLIISFVARFSKHKFVFDALELARRLHRNRDDFVMVMVGSGEEEGPVMDTVQSEGLGDCVRVLGFQPRDVVAAVRRNSAVSLCLLDGFSLIEACAAGRPVVAYDVEWHSELLEPGTTGFLVPEGDVEALTDRVNWVLDHPTEAARMGTEARRRAVQRHSLDTASQRRRSHYSEMLATPPKQRSKPLSGTTPFNVCL